MLKRKGGLPRMEFCTKDVLADYHSNGGTSPFWLDEIVAHGSRSWRKGVLLKNDLEDYSFCWKVPFSCLKNPSVTLGDAFAPGAILLITPESFEVSRKTVVVHPQTISVHICTEARIVSVGLGKNVFGIDTLDCSVPCVRPARMEQNFYVSLPKRRFSGSHIAHFEA
jgi:hypothetical protein